MATHHSPRNKQGKPAGDNELILALGAQIAQRRRELGIVQQQLADAARISRSTLHTIEHGGAGVRWEKVTAVAEALGLEMRFVPKD
ncbi:helix-turn-helix domain-containing protein [Corynebacterium macginleyi]